MYGLTGLTLFAALTLANPPPITAENWRKHPLIVEVRQEYDIIQGLEREKNREAAVTPDRTSREEKKTMDDERAKVAKIVIDLLVDLLRSQGVMRAQVAEQASLVEDLGMDSMKFIDLTVMLEKALGIAEFPMQDWQDRESLRDGPRYTVGALVDACLESMDAAPRPDAGDPDREQ